MCKRDNIILFLWLNHTWKYYQVNDYLELLTCILYSIGLHTMLMWIKSICLFFVLLFFITAGLIVHDGLSDNIQKADVAIILGTKVNLNGLPSSRLKARLNKGITLYQQEWFHHIIVSGAKGKEGWNEAVIMKKYLVAHGIPNSAIITDKQGVDTQATALNSSRVMSQHGFKSALVISQYFHITRARLALNRCGITTVYQAHANYFDWRDLYAIPREVAGYYDYYFLRQWPDKK